MLIGSRQALDEGPGDAAGWALGEADAAGRPVGEADAAGRVAELPAPRLQPVAAVRASTTRMDRFTPLKRASPHGGYWPGIKA